jgi:hypothetical protein
LGLKAPVQHGEMARPNGMKIKSSDAKMIDDYLAAK